jgi:alanine racemase
MSGFPQPTLEIDLAAIVANWRSLRERHGAATGAAVKANAYGLGAADVAPALHAAGCRHFFVATLDEALALRPLLPEASIMVLNGAMPGSEAEFIAHDLIPVLNSLDDLARWQLAARQAGQSLRAVLHVDTGMARLGLDEREFALLRAEPHRLEGISLDYVMSHLAAAEQPDSPQNEAQRARFAAIRAAFPSVRASLANSSGIFLGPGFASDLARPGYALYGGNPTPGRPNPMRNVARLTAPVLQVRQIGPGDSVGYNATWRAARPSRIATIGIGYADGFLRSLSNATSALGGFDAKPIPLVGRVSMDLINFDVTDFPAIVPGSLLKLIGPGRDVDALARDAGTSGYEILTSLGSRYRRVVKSA